MKFCYADLMESPRLSDVVANMVPAFDELA